MMDDESIEIARILHHPAQDPGIANGPRAIAESDGARLLQQADLGDFRALEARRQGRRRKHPHAAGIARAAQEKIDDRRLVDRRIGIGPGKDRRDAACRRRQSRGRDRLAVLGTRLADEGPHVDEARRHAIAAAIDDPRMSREICRHDGGAHIADQAIDDQDAAGCFGQCGGIDQSCMDQRQRLVGNGGRGEWRYASRETRSHPFGKCCAKASKTAIRTATPISTCSRIRLLSPSATAEIDFDAAVHRTWMHDKRIRLGIF